MSTPTRRGPGRPARDLRKAHSTTDLSDHTQFTGRLVAVDDPYSSATRARWDAAALRLAEAQRHVQIGAGVVWALLRVEPRRANAEAILRRWCDEVLDDLDALRDEHELPRPAA